MLSQKSRFNQPSSTTPAGLNIGKNALSVSARPAVQRESADQTGSAQIFRQEDEPVAQTSGGAITVGYPSSPSGNEQHSSGISNNSSNEWGAFIENDRVLFEFEYTGSDAVTISVVLTDDQGNGFLSQGAVHWEGGSEGGKQYIEFSGFPLRPDGGIMRSCATECTMINNTSESTGVHGYEKIYRG